MKRREVIKRIKAEAKSQGVDFDLDREGGSHSVFDVGGCMIPIPRHTEIGEGLAREIFKECEPVLGKDWWRN
jgi:hypothetical protein